MFDLLIKNTEIIDGTGARAFRGSVAVKDGKIHMAEGNEDAVRVLDGAGLTLTPGFIDVHSHGDMVAGHDYARLCKISQGITTEVAGQCGSSCFPVLPESAALVETSSIMLGALERQHLTEFTGLAGYRSFLDTVPLSANIMTFAGHSALRLAVMGTSDAKPDASQMDQMKALLREAMEHGCAGLSTGLFYPPSAYADVDEVAELCSVVAEYGGIHTSHIRNEGSGVLKSIEEVLEVSRRTGVALNISHHKVCGRKNWGLSDKTLALVEKARAEGLQVTMDVYPYTASMTKLAACIPTEYFVKGTTWLQKALSDPALRKEIREKMEHFEDGRYRQCGGFTGVMIGGCPTRPEAEGKFISDYANELGADPFEVFFDLVAEDGGQCTAIYFTMCEEDLDRIIKAPWTMIGTDGLAVSMTGKTHPRSWGSFPRAIRLFVREKKLLTMEEMIHRITGLAAQTYQMPGKGRIAEGFDADLVLFNKDTICDMADFTDSSRLTDGIRAVITGGAVVLEDGVMTGACPGTWIGLGGRR